MHGLEGGESGSTGLPYPYRLRAFGASLAALDPSHPFIQETHLTARPIILSRHAQLFWRFAL